MLFDNYMKLAQRTSKTKNPGHKIDNGKLGLIGEAGEVVDVIKKMLYQDMPDEKANEKILDELGDVLWYCAEMLTGFEESYPYHVEVKRVECTINQHIITNPNYISYSFKDVQELAVILARITADIGRFAAPAPMDIERIACVVCTIGNKLGVSLSEIMEHNIEKLKKRYPEGFDAERSNERYA